MERRTSPTVTVMVPFSTGNKILFGKHPIASEVVYLATEPLQLGTILEMEGMLVTCY